MFWLAHSASSRCSCKALQQLFHWGWQSGFESERTSSEEPRAAVSVFQTVGFLDAAYGILHDLLWEVWVLVLDGLREDT